VVKGFGTKCLSPTGSLPLWKIECERGAASIALPWVDKKVLTHQVSRVKITSSPIFVRGGLRETVGRPINQLRVSSIALKEGKSRIRLYPQGKKIETGVK